MERLLRAAHCSSASITIRRRLPSTLQRRPRVVARTRVSAWRDRRRDAAREAGCEFLHMDFDDDLRDFYVGACGFEPTNAGLSDLTAVDD